MRDSVVEFDDVVYHGLHPLYVNDNKTPLADMHGHLKQLSSEPRVVAIGETGLDYFYDPDSKAIQQQSFNTYRCRR